MQSLSLALQGRILAFADRRFVLPYTRTERPLLTSAKEIAYFSFDEKHEFRLDDSSLRYYYPPSLPADLNEGFETFQQLDDTDDDHLDALLETIVAHEQKTCARIDTDVVTWRGMMTKV